MRSDESFADLSGFLTEKSFEKLITAFIIYIFYSFEFVFCICRIPLETSITTFFKLPVFNNKNKGI
jgi:hypothetical protein